MSRLPFRNTSAAVLATLLLLSGCAQHPVQTPATPPLPTTSAQPTAEAVAVFSNQEEFQQCLDSLRIGRVFFMGDTAKIVSPFGARGGNTGVADADNLAWKLAAVLRGRASPRLLDSYNDERAPIAKQIVTRANQSIAEFGPIFEALGMDGGVDHEKIQRSMAVMTQAQPMMVMKEMIIRSCQPI